MMVNDATAIPSGARDAKQESGGHLDGSAVSLRKVNSMRVYEAVVKALEALGVDAVFGGVGENDASLLLALKHSNRIKTVVTRHEQAASFMACGYAMFSRRLGVCFATAGPGGFNFFSGLAVALSDSHPLLAISGYARTDWSGKGALNETSGLGRTPDSQAMFAASTKHSYFLSKAEDICDLLEEAVNCAFEGRPGPVHIHIPEDTTRTEIPDASYHDIRLKIAPVLPDPAQVSAASDAIAEALRQRKRVLALIGAGAVISGAGSELRTLVETFGIPFVTTLDGKGIISEAHPQALGIFSTSGNKGAREAFKEADLVLAVGNSFAQYATFGFHAGLFQDKKLIHVNIDASEIGKVYPADYPLVSDAKPAIAALNSALSLATGVVAQAPVTADDFRNGPIVHLGGHIHPGHLVQSLSKLLPDNCIILADAGSHAAWLGYYLELSRGQNFRKPGSFGAMAGHTNGALGAKCAQPDRAVIVGCGDGCYLLSGFELLTAVQYDIPVIWIIFNNGEFQLIKLFQLATFFESGNVEFNNPDYVTYAAACGAKGYRVETVAEFEDALRAAIASGRPTVIDAAITRLAVPPYSPGPEGILGAIAEAIEKRI
jgi:acetolactate synthase-1/2/3 large subunit